MRGSLNTISVPGEAMIASGKRTAEPGIEYVFIPLQLVTVAFRARHRVLARHDHLAAIAAIPGRDAMSPPELARDAPVVDIFHPAEVLVLGVFGRKGDVTRWVVGAFRNGGGSLGERFDFLEPLRRNAPLEHRSTALADAEGHFIRLDFFDQPLRFEISHNALAGFHSIDALVHAGIFVHA